MFTADGLRPDSPHLMPPRGAASVLSLSLSASTRALVPLLPTRKPSRSLLLVLSISLSLFRSLFLSLSVSLFLPPVSRIRVVSSVCTVLHRCVLLRFTSLWLSSRFYPHQSCPAASAKAGYSDRGSESVFSARERIDFRRRQWHRKMYEMNGDEGSHTRARLTLHV